MTDFQQPLFSARIVLIAACKSLSWPHVLMDRKDLLFLKILIWKAGYCLFFLI